MSALTWWIGRWLIACRSPVGTARAALGIRGQRQTSWRPIGIRRGSNSQGLGYALLESGNRSGLGADDGFDYGW